jgi:uncharacterized protein
MKIVSLIILLFLLILSLFNSKRDSKKYNIFKSFTRSRDRQRMYKKMVLESFLIYGCISVLGLVLLNQFSALINFPNFLLEYSNYIRSFKLNSAEGITAIRVLKVIMVYLIPFLLLATSFLNLILVYVQHKKSNQESPVVGSHEINHLLPKNSKERYWISVISINAGLSEELFFRLFLPILVYIIFESPMISILLPSIWFGLVHSYQGRNGIIFTFIAGLMLFYIYLLTQNIWITILVHIFLDLNGLVITPLFKNLLEKKSKSELV